MYFPTFSFTLSHIHFSSSLSLLCSSPLSFFCLLRFRNTFTCFLIFPSSISHSRVFFSHTFILLPLLSPPHLFFSFTHVTINLLDFCFVLLLFSFHVPFHRLLFFSNNSSYPLYLFVLLYYIIHVCLLLYLLAPKLFSSSGSLLLALPPRNPPTRTHTHTDVIVHSGFEKVNHT